MEERLGWEQLGWYFDGGGKEIRSGLLREEAVDCR
jgi:hypothetical protein